MQAADSRTNNRLLRDAHGTISGPHLLNRRWGLVRMLADGPLVAHLEPDEQPHYLFVNPTHGVEVTHPDGTVEQVDPPTTSAVSRLSEWVRFFLVTDRRVLYVVGDEAGDRVRSVPFSALTAARGVDGRADAQVVLVHTDGREIAFTDGSLRMDTPARERINYGQRYAEEAAAYVERRIAETDALTPPDFPV